MQEMGRTARKARAGSSASIRLSAVRHGDDEVRHLLRHRFLVGHSEGLHGIVGGQDHDDSRFRPRPGEVNHRWNSGWKPVPAAMRQILERSEGKLVPLIYEPLRTYQGDYGAIGRRLLLTVRALADPHEEAGEDVSFAYGLGISPVLRFTIQYGLIFPLGIGGLLLALPT